MYWPFLGQLGIYLKSSFIEIYSFRTLYPPLSHYLLLNNTQKTLVIKVQSTSSLERMTTDDLTCISNKLDLFILFYNY